MRLRPMRSSHLAPVVGVAAMAVMLAACVPGANGGSSTADETPPQQTDGPVELIVWTDPTRQVGFEMYQELHPDVELTIETLPDDVDSRIQLANQAGSGWPDVIVLKRFQFEDYAREPYNFSADISGYLPEGIMDEFSPALVDRCAVDGAVYCLNNDISPLVLWYDKDLMEEFGYEVPQTWEEFEELGLRLAEEHPGYVVGDAGIQNSWLPASRCPMAEVTGDKTMRTDLQDEKCTRVATMVDTLIEAGSLSPLGANDPEFVAEYGEPRRILMSVQPLHRGRFGFIDEYGWPEGSLGIAPPLRWENEDQVYNYVGGGVGYAVSRHSEQQQAAAELIQWMATGDYQTDPDTVTFPAYRPAQQTWIDNNSDAFYSASGDASEVIETAESAISSYWSDINILSVFQSYSRVVMPELVNGSTVTELLPEWQEFVVNEATAASWTVEEG